MKNGFLGCKGKRKICQESVLGLAVVLQRVGSAQCQKRGDSTPKFPSWPRPGGWLGLGAVGMREWRSWIPSPPLLHPCRASALGVLPIHEPERQEMMEEERGIEGGQSPKPSPGHTLGTGSCQPLPADPGPAIPKPPCPPEGALPQVWVKMGILRTRCSLPASPSSSLELIPARRRKLGSHPGTSHPPRAEREKQDQGSASCQDTGQQREHHTQGQGTPSMPAPGPACPQGGQLGLGTAAAPKGQKTWGIFPTEGRSQVVALRA